MVKSAFALAAALAAGPALGAAADEPLRTVEIAELHRDFGPALTAALDGPPRIAGRAALAIGRTKNPAGAPALRAHLGVADPAERAMVAYALGLLADGPSLDILRYLGRADPNSATRYAAVDAVGRIAVANPQLATRDAGLDLLTVARFDADPVVRGHAAAQLEAFGSQPFAPELARDLEGLARRERDEDVRWHVMWVLFRGYAKVADPAFLRAALHDRSELVRVEALRAWGRRSDSGAAALVRPLLADPSWRVQFEARETLRRLAKLPPTEHLTVDPPGLHLPSAVPAPVLAAPRPSPAASGLPKATAPDPATFPLPAYARLPASATEMNGPADGPHPRVLIRTTKGDLVIVLYPEWAPATVANFLALAERGYFDGNRWFRIVPDFVVQTGDPTGSGDGDAGYTIPAEENPVEQRSGVIAMGLDYQGSRAVRDSAGTQFYITLSPQLHLDRDFSVFGAVASGFDVLPRLVESDRMTLVERIADR